RADGRSPCASKYSRLATKSGYAAQSDGGARHRRRGCSALSANGHMTINTQELTTILPHLFGELVHGSPDPSVGTYMLNRGDAGLLQSLEKISADAASSTVHGGGSIAMHTDHIRYGLALLNRWAAGADKPWKGADWTASWRIVRVSDEEWR